MHLELLFLALLQAAVKGAECPCNESHDSSTSHVSFLQEESALNAAVNNEIYPPDSGFLQKESAAITEQGAALPPGFGFLQKESAAITEQGAALPPGFGFLQEESVANVNVDKGYNGQKPLEMFFLQDQATLKTDSERQNFYVPFPPGAGVGRSSTTPSVLLEKDARMRAKLQPKTLLQAGVGRKSNRA